MKQILRAAFVIMLSLLLFIAYKYRSLILPNNSKAIHLKTLSISDTLLDKKLQNQNKKINNYARTNNCNTKLCFLIDMSRPSGKNRFFVYNMQKDSIELSGLVAHGSGDSKFAQKPSFSNTINSYPSKSRF